MGVNCTHGAVSEQVQAHTCPLLEMQGVVLTFPASAPVCFCKPCLLAHLTLHKGRRQSRPRSCIQPPRGEGALANRVSSSSRGKTGRCAHEGVEEMEGEEGEAGLLLALDVGRGGLVWFFCLYCSKPRQPCAVAVCRGREVCRAGRQDVFTAVLFAWAQHGGGAPSSWGRQQGHPGGCPKEGAASLPTCRLCGPFVGGWIPLNHRARGPSVSLAPWRRQGRPGLSQTSSSQTYGPL